MTPQSACSSKALCKTATLVPGGTSFYMQLQCGKRSLVVMCMAGILMNQQHGGLVARTNLCEQISFLQPTLMLSQ
jgi:hypothetical protein